VCQTVPISSEIHEVPALGEASCSRTDTNVSLGRGVNLEPHPRLNGGGRKGPPVNSRRLARTSVRHKIVSLLVPRLNTVLRARESSSI
jgi:hypothetical protein